MSTSVFNEMHHTRLHGTTNKTHAIFAGVLGMVFVVLALVF